jgi:hypothetical protein
MEQW